GWWGGPGGRASRGTPAGWAPPVPRRAKPEDRQPALPPGSGRSMILVLDNYDSFPYNLVQYLGQLGATMRAPRTDKISVGELARIAPEGIVISPGPGYPDSAGISLDLIRRLHASTPILGVCLGHQAIGQAFGGKVSRARKQMHGKTSRIHHDSRGVFEGLPQDFEATRYHSLVVQDDSLPA